MHSLFYKVGCISTIKIKVFGLLFCISLDLHYLCTRKHCHGLSLVLLKGGTRGKSGQHRTPHF